MFLNQYEIFSVSRFMTVKNQYDLIRIIPIQSESSRPRIHSD